MVKFMQAYRWAFFKGFSLDYGILEVIGEDEMDLDALAVLRIWGGAAEEL